MQHNSEKKKAPERIKEYSRQTYCCEATRIEKNKDVATDVRDVNVHDRCCWTIAHRIKYVHR